MAFAGLNVTFGFIKTSNNQPLSPAPIYGPMTSSDNMGSPGTSAVSAPEPTPNTTSIPMASVYAAVDSWITVGIDPADPSEDSPIGGKRFIPATTVIDFFCNPGDFVRWDTA